MKRFEKILSAFIDHLSFVNATVSASFWHLRALNIMLQLCRSTLFELRWKLWLTRGHGKFSESSTRPQGQQQARHMALLQWLGQRQSVWIQWFISILCFQMEKIYIYISIYMCLYCRLYIYEYIRLYLTCLFNPWCTSKNAHESECFRSDYGQVQCPHAICKPSGA